MVRFQPRDQRADGIQCQLGDDDGSYVGDGAAVGAVVANLERRERDAILRIAVLALGFSDK